MIEQNKTKAIMIIKRQKNQDLFQLNQTNNKLFLQNTF